MLFTGRCEYAIKAFGVNNVRNVVHNQHLLFAKFGGLFIRS